MRSKLVRCYSAALLALAATSCGGAFQGASPFPSKPSLPLPLSGPAAFDLVACSGPIADNYCDGPDDATFTITQVAEHPDPPRVQIGSDDGYVFVRLIPSTWMEVQIDVTAAGYAPFRATAQTADLIAANAKGLHNLFGTLIALYPQPEARAPLALESADRDGTACHSSAVTPIPDGPDIDFWRGDAWGVTPPGGLAAVAGGSDAAPQQLLTWFLDRLPVDQQRASLDQYRRDGYTHFALSIPDSRDGNGQSVEQYVSTSLRVKAEIPFVAHFLTSKDFDPRNATAATRMAAIAPYVDALVQANAADILVVGWELDLFNDPHLLQDFIDALASRYPGIPLYVHFSTYHTAWQFDGEPRAAFWARNVGKLTGLLYQANPSDPCGLMQAHFGDALSTASGLKGFKLVAWELVAQQQFFGRVSEDQANARGWEVLNTPGGVVGITGFGNGARRPDGSPLLLKYPR